MAHLTVPYRRFGERIRADPGALGIIRRESDRAGGDLGELTNGVRDALSRLRTIGIDVT